MEEDEERFRDLSFKDKVLTIIIAIILVLFYLVVLLGFIFVFIPVRYSVCYIANDFLFAI